MRVLVLLSADSTPSPPYRPVVRAGDWVICSGHIGIKDGVVVEGGIAAQLSRAIDNLAQSLEREGLSLGDIVKTTVFLTDMGEYAAMNDAYVAAFGEHRPARSAVEVSALPFGAAVEIEAWAFAPNR